MSSKLQALLLMVIYFKSLATSLVEPIGDPEVQSMATKMNVVH